MKKKNALGKYEKITPYTKDEVEAILTKYNITLENNAGYDCAYIATMAKADYMGSSIADEAHFAKFIKDYIDDVDGYDGLPFTRFYADCIGSGNPIP